MGTSPPPSVPRLVRARGREQRDLAQRIVEGGVPWPAWEKGFRRAYLRDPARAARAARALETASAASGDDLGAARFRAWRGIALQRSGSPAEAARLLAEAAQALEAGGDADRAASVLALAVDALAHAGEIDEALRVADAARKRLRGERAPLWRAVLLGNRANALRLAGRLEEAARASDASARALERLGHPASAAVPRLNAGVALLYAGHLDRARRRFAAAHETFETAGHTDRALVARYDLACLDLRRGELGKGIRDLEVLATRFAGLGQRRQEALCRMDLSDGLRRAGDGRTAAREAKTAARLFAQEGAVAEEVEALWLAVAAGAPDQPGRAAVDLRRAKRRALGVGRAELALRCELLRHDLGLRRGEKLDGRTLRGLHDRARRLGQHEIAAEALLLAGEGARRRGDLAAARRALDGLPALARRHPWLEAAAQTLRARIEIDAGEPGRAARRLRRCAAELDRIRSGLPGAWLRTTFLFEQLDPYLALVDVLLERGRAPDRREAERLLDRLARLRFRQGRTPRGEARRASEHRRRLERLYDRLAEGSGPTRGLNVAQRSALLDEVGRLERQIADAWRRRERRAARRNGNGNGYVDAGDDAAVVHVWLRGREVRALCRRGREVQGALALGDVGRIDKAVRELGFHAHRVRATGSRPARVAFADALRLLGSRLLRDLDALRDAADVRLVLDARLPDVPWELLPFEDAPLAVARRFARVPAARLPAARRARGRGFTVVAAGESALPGVVREALHVGRGARLVHGDEATRSAVVEALETRRVVHLAMHGVAAPEAPALGGLRLADGWFTAADVPAEVGADVVSLAACRTGAPPSPAGLAWGALPSALMRSGARWVLWTSGDVDDEATADLMSRFHPVTDSARVPRYLGRAIEHASGVQGTLARLLPFRLSGGRI